MRLEVNPTLLRWASACVSDDRSRPALTGVLLTKDGKIVATNGHILFEGQDKFGGLWRPRLIRVHGQIPASTERAVLNLDEFDPRLGRLDLYVGTWLSRKRQGRTRRRLWRELKPLLCEELAGLTYPDYEHALPKGAPQPLPKVGIGAAYLAQAARMFESFTMEFYGELAPMVLRSGETDGSDARLIVMPMRVS